LIISLVKNRTKQEFLLAIPFEYILGFSKETRLIRDNSCFTKKDFVHRLLKNLDKFECQYLYESYKKGKTYKFSAEWFLDKFPTGGIISKNFVESLNSQNSSQKTIYFEFPVFKTRVDILALSENSHAFEVKSQRDKLDRLNYQIPALKEYFENVSLIIPLESKQKIIEHLDREIGIITFKTKDDKIIFEIEREPTSIDDFNEFSQMELLHVDELRTIYSEYVRSPTMKLYRKDLIHNIIEFIPRHKINELFKTTIRERGKVRNPKLTPKRIDLFFES
jgi:hypothetical protein